MTTLHRFSPGLSFTGIVLSYVKMVSSFTHPRVAPEPSIQHEDKQTLDEDVKGAVITTDEPLHVYHVTDEMSLD